MPLDFYAETRALGNSLWDAGFASWAERLDSVMLGGATPTEILMGVRWTLGQLLDSAPVLPAALQQQVVALRRALDEALR